MSRIGKLPINIPQGVSVTITEATVTIKGPKGEITKAFDPAAVIIEQKDNEVLVKPANESRFARAMYGTARSIIANMVQGVTEPFKKNLTINGVGFRAVVKGQILDLALGHSHPIAYTIPAGVSVIVTENTKVEVSGVDKHLVGQVAASIKHFRPANKDPYKKKGVHIVGEFLRTKAGKKTA